MEERTLQKFRKYKLNCFVKISTYYSIVYDELEFKGQLKVEYNKLFKDGNKLDIICT